MASPLDELPDLRPSPWRAHLWCLAILAALYAVFALAIWPSSSQSELSRNLTLVVIGLYGAGVALFAAVTTVVVTLLPRHRSLFWAYLLGLLLSALLVAALVLAPALL